MDNFREWLQQQIEILEISNNEFARRAGISPAGVSVVLSGAKEPTWDFCAAISKPLGLAPLEVFIKAGKLVSAGGANEESREAISRLSAEERILLDIFRRADSDYRPQIIRAAAAIAGLEVPDVPA